MLERRVVLQAIGRVRPFTTRAEVILFQCDDLSPELGSIEEFGSLAEARHQLQIPTLAQLKRTARGETVRADRMAARTRTIAADLGDSAVDGSGGTPRRRARPVAGADPAMTAITLFPEFEQAIQGLREPEPWTLPIRPNTARLSEQIRLIEEADQGAALLAQLNRLRLVRSRSIRNSDLPAILSNSGMAGPGRIRPPFSR